MAGRDPAIQGHSANYWNVLPWMAASRAAMT